MELAKPIQVSILISILLTYIPAKADSYSDSPSCSKPHKPYDFSDEWERDNFFDDVDRYKRCIEDFVEEQNDAIENHQDAANEAIEEWERFVRYELNY